MTWSFSDGTKITSDLVVTGPSADSVQRTLGAFLLGRLVIASGSIPSRYRTAKTREDLTSALDTLARSRGLRMKSKHRRSYFEPLPPSKDGVN